MATVKYAKVLDTRLEALSSNDICFVVEEGAQVVNYTPLNSSSHSNNNTNFNLNNIADVVCRQSRLVVGMTIDVSIPVSNNSTNTVNVITSDNFGFKQFPLNRCISSVQHQINQASYTLNTYDILDAIARVNLLPDDSNFFENEMPDFIDSYGNATGSAINPLQPYASMPVGSVYKPRSLNIKVISGNTLAPNASGTVVLQCKIYEPLLTPWCDISGKDSRGLYAITGELINISYVTDLFNNMFAWAIPSYINYTNGSASVNLGTSALLYTVYLTPKEQTVAQIPHESVYQYSDYSVFSNQVGSSPWVAKSVQQVSSQVVNFTNLPQKILVYARLSNSARRCNIPDKYLAIQSLQCTFDNGQPQLTNVDLNGNQLWEVSKRNGLTLPRASFQQLKINSGVSGYTGDLYGCGPVMVIDPSLDLGIRATDCAGSVGRYVFQVSATFVNNTDIDFSQVTMYVIGLTNAILERNGSQYRNYLLSSPNNIVNMVRELSPISHQEYMDAKHSNSFLSGGGVGDWFKKAWGVIKSAPSYAKEAIGIAKDLKGVYDVGKSLVGKGAQRLGMMRGVHPPKGQMYYD